MSALPSSAANIVFIDDVPKERLSQPASAASFAFDLPARNVHPARAGADKKIEDGAVRFRYMIGAAGLRQQMAAQPIAAASLGHGRS